MKKDIMFLFLFICTILLASCSTYTSTPQQAIIKKYIVKVNSYGEDSTLIRKDCYLFLSDTLINKEDLQFKEFHKLISSIMRSKGYNVVDSIQSANIIILFNYGISNPLTKVYNTSVPVWGQTRISSTTTSDTVSANPYSNNLNYKLSTEQTPNYVVSGYRSEQHTIESYTRYLNLVAYDFEYLKLHNKEKRIWQTEISSTGYSNDLRAVFPYMLIASRLFIGHSSSVEKEFNINSDNLDVKKLKGE